MRTTILALAMIGSAMPAIAQTPPPPHGGGGGMRGGMLMRADANGDGVITRAEATAAADARFDRLDADHDGTLTPDEMRAGRRGMSGPGPDAPPPPPPGAGAPPPPMGRSTTREQSRERALAMFDRADANHDGRVDQAELAALPPGPRDYRTADDTPPPPPSPQQ